MTALPSRLSGLSPDQLQKLIEYADYAVEVSSLDLPTDRSRPAVQHG